jgi:hypothetical protein
MSQISAGQLDRAVLATGVPVPALFELDQKEGMKFLPFTSDQIGILKQRMPKLIASEIPNGAYPSLTTKYHTVDLFNFPSRTGTFPKIWFTVSSRHFQKVCTISPDSLCSEGDRSCQYKERYVPADAPRSRAILSWTGYRPSGCSCQWSLTRRGACENAAWRLRWGKEVALFSWEALILLRQ